MWDKILEFQRQRNYLWAERRALVGFLMVLKVDLKRYVLQEGISLAGRWEVFFVRCQKQFIGNKGE